MESIMNAPASKSETKHHLCYWQVYNIAFHILIIIAMTVILIGAIYIVAQQAWLMVDLKNKCIHDCLIFNQEAIRKGIEERCVC